MTKYLIANLAWKDPKKIVKKVLLLRTTMLSVLRCFFCVKSFEFNGRNFEKLLDSGFQIGTDNLCGVWDAN